MKTKELSPQKIWDEYLRGEDYHIQTGLHDIVKKNTRFFNGDQWEGLNAPDIEKPVINIFKRTITYLGSQIISDDVGIELEPFAPSPESESSCRLLTEQIDRVIEITKAKTKNREAIKEAAITGDGAVYAWFNPENGKAGEIELELVDNEKVIFANPFEKDIQKQKYIIIVKRMMLEDVQEMAEGFGVPEDEINAIIPDDRTDYAGEKKETGKSLVTVLLRFWKENGKVWFCESCQDVFIRKPTETAAKIYHVAWLPWDSTKNSYHGAAAMTPYIPNQIYINKMWALATAFSTKMAFPARFYDATKFRTAPSNKIGQAIGVSGDPKEAIWVDSPAGNMSTQVLELVDRTIQYTRESLGVNDAALGDVKPENTSALVMAAEQTAAPLVFQRLANHQFWEDLVHIFIDIIKEMYGLRTVYTEIAQPDGTMAKGMADVDFGAIDYDAFDIKVNVGNATYWSQLMQVQTIDSFFRNGIISDAVEYLEHLPDGYVSGKEELIREIKEKQEAMKKMQMQMPGEQQAVPAQNVPGGTEGIAAPEMPDELRERI